MTPFTVYLAVRNTRPGNKSDAMDRHLCALRALHDELLAVGIRVTPLPDLADLGVEITNVFVAGDSHAGRPAAEHPQMSAEGERIMSIRLSAADEHVELVCSDGMGRVPAERHAAQRILMRLDGLSRPRMTDLVHARPA
jgi:hypothetical protein